MNSTLRPILLAALVLALSGAEVLAWSMGGHRVTGVIAARDLAAESPRVAEAVAVIMQAHPAAAEFDARMREAGADRAAQLERLFAEIAQWPDEIRRGPLRHFHRGDWHTIEIPYVVAGHKLAAVAEPAAENMLWALRENTRIAADPAAGPAERAVALCWVFHLVGDMQQPLHAISLFSETFPSGDRYGSLFWVRLPAGDEAVSLHYYWDSAIQRSQNTLDVERTAAHLSAGHPRGALEELRERPYRGANAFERWTREESHRLAVSAGYRDGRLAGAADKQAALRLNDDYAVATRAIAARRMALAGYRLADVLRAIFP
jgi:hypothetical protein